MMAPFDAGEPTGPPARRRLRTPGPEVRDGHARQVERCMHVDAPLAVQGPEPLLQRDISQVPVQLTNVVRLPKRRIVRATISSDALSSVMSARTTSARRLAVETSAH